MSISTRAIEVSGMVDKEHNLILDENLPLKGPIHVKVVVFYQEDEEDISEGDWMRFVSKNADDILSDPAEDIYTLEDGKPIDV